MVTASLVDNANRPRADDSGLSAAVPLGLSNTGSAAPSFPPLSRCDFPHVRFWTKKEWDEHSSRLKDASGSKGKAPDRFSKGLNTTALYMENENGMPISGDTVTQMRAAARMVWIELFDRGKAPISWGKASLDARNMYYSELEMRWGFLRFCENHWKADALATANYSQWYRSHKGRITDAKAAEKGEVSEARAPKRSKTVGEEGEALQYMRSEFTAEPDDFGSLRSETPMDNIRIGDDQVSEAEDEVPRGVGNVLTGPKARPLMDPL